MFKTFLCFLYTYLKTNDHIIFFLSHMKTKRPVSLVMETGKEKRGTFETKERNIIMLS